MDDSDSQFQELLAHLVARTNKMLAQQNEMLSLGLMLLNSGEVEVAIGIADTPAEMHEALDAMRTLLAEAAATRPVVATCTAYPNYEDGTVVALLENNENYCLTITIPVLTSPTLSLDLDNLQDSDGFVYIFPIVDDA